MQGDGARDGLGEDEEGRPEGGRGVGGGDGGGVEELAEAEELALFGGGVDEFVGYVRDGGVFEADDGADEWGAGDGGGEGGEEAGAGRASGC